MTTIWIIEDNIPYGNTICKVINESDWCRCEEVFTTVNDALIKLDSKEVPDIILTDLNLPGMNGLEGIKEIKKTAPGIEIIVLTSFDDDDKIFDAICSGANGYLVKSSSSEEIMDAILTVRDGGSSTSAQVARKVFSMFSSLRPADNDYNLSAREKEILGFLVEGKSIKEIAQKTFTSPQTVQTHVRNIYVKVQVSNRGGLVTKAIREGLVNVYNPKKK